MLARLQFDCCIAFVNDQRLGAIGIIRNCAGNAHASTSLRAGFRGWACFNPLYCFSAEASAGLEKSLGSIVGLSSIFLNSALLVSLPSCLF